MHGMLLACTRPWRQPWNAALVLLIVAVLAPGIAAGLTSEPLFAHQLAGRPLLVRNAKGFRLHSALEDNDVAKTAARRQPCLVRVQHPPSKNLLKSLHAIGGDDVRYIPNDSYLVSATQAEMKMLSQEEEVAGIFHVPAELKVGEEIFLALQRRSGLQADEEQLQRRGLGHHNQPMHERLKPRSASGKVEFLIGTANRVSNDPSMQAEYMKEVEDTIASCGLTGATTLKLESSTRISGQVTPNSEVLAQWVHCVTAATWSVWIVERPQYLTRNYNANRVVQSSGLQTPIWDVGLTGEGEVIGVADTGLDWDGCFFTDSVSGPGENISFCVGDGAIADCVNFKHRKVVSYRTLKDVVKDEDFSHEFNQGSGTYATGTILGSWLTPPGGSSAPSRHNGVAPDAKVSFDDIGDDKMDAFNADLKIPADLAEQLFPHSYEMAGARVLSNSWGFNWNEYDANSMDVDHFAYQHDDVLIFFAPGWVDVTESGPVGTISSPATNKNGIAVGSVYNTAEFYGDGSAGRSENVIASFSPLGPTSDGRIKPDLYCIGSDVASASADMASACPSSADKETVEKGGTSATGTCAGAAALAREYCRKGYWPSGVANGADAFLPTSALVKALLISSATTQPLTHPFLPGLTTPSLELGFGRVDLSAVLKLQGTSEPAFELKLVNRAQVSHGTYMEYVITSSGPVRVTLVWTDPPSYPQAERALVNNLDLRVVRPDGSELRGNDFGGKGVADSVNNVEHVDIPGGAGNGEHRVQVLGTEVAWLTQTQNFALVFAGSFVDEDVESSGSIDPFPVQHTPTCVGRVTLTEVTGSVADGSGGGNNYSNYLFCEWLIVVPNATSIKVSLGEHDVQAGKDVVQMFACEDEQCQRKELAGDSDHPPQFSADAFKIFSSVVLIRFSSDDTVTGSGFQVVWNASFEVVKICDGSSLMSQASGSFSDGPSGLAYQPDQHCEWTIAPPGATALTLTFDMFDTEEDYDFVHVYACSTVDCARALLLTTLSGSQSGKTVFSPTSAIKVVFTSDIFVHAEGFTASWNSSFTPPAGNAPPKCSGVVNISDPAVAVKDGSGLDDYSNQLFCQFVIAPELPGNTIELVASDFETHSEGDFVRVYTCEDQRCLDPVFAGQVSGSKTGTSARFTSPAILLLFVTDGSGTGPGFTMTWAALTVEPACANLEVFRSPAGSISDGSGAARPYANNAYCQFILAPVGAATVNLQFTTFETDPGYDTIWIASCEDARCSREVQAQQVYLHRGLSGNMSGFSVTSSTGVMRVVFITDGISVFTSHFQGFTASWTSSFPLVEPECVSEVFTDPAGSFSDKSSAAPYASDMYCEWIIAPSSGTSVQLQFTRFETEPYDYVDVFECEDARCLKSGLQLLNYSSSGSFSGWSLTSSTGVMLVVFTYNHDGNVTAAGFDAVWSAPTPTTIIEAATTAADATTPAPTLFKVAATMTLVGMSDADWTSAAETVFINALASWFGKAAADVTVTGTSAVRQRRTRMLMQSTGLQVDYEVAGFESAAAVTAAQTDAGGKVAALVTTLQADDAFKNKLTGIELPDAVVDQDDDNHNAGVDQDDDDQHVGRWVGIGIAAGALGAFIVCCAVFAFASGMFSPTPKSEVPAAASARRAELAEVTPLSQSRDFAVDAKQNAQPAHMQLPVQPIGMSPFPPFPFVQGLVVGQA